MKLLWVKTDFLHPTTRGGQIRTLEMLKRLHRRHEVHYVAFDDPAFPEGPARAHEYCSKAYPIEHRLSDKRSPRFAVDLARGLFSTLPVAVLRYRSSRMQQVISDLERTGGFDAVVCDFLAPSVNIERIERCALFEHNVETVIWQRHASNAPDPLRRAFFGLQAKRMREHEGDACRRASRVVTVSREDSRTIADLFGRHDACDVPTGVDVDFFRRPEGEIERRADLAFLGSMDWMPNIHGVEWFVREILPLVRRRRPETTLAVVGRNPAPAVRALVSPAVAVTGTVPDVRPWLWGAAVSIVPLKIGGGTRLKIYESMAAGTAVVSTAVGAEGLEVHPPDEIRIADEPEAFAEQCLQLLNDAEERRRAAQAALELVRSRFSWEYATARFEAAIGLA